jgi:hypothetical protein
MNTGLKNEKLVGKILVSGSSALKPKNNGINLFEELSIDDGVVSSKLLKPKYNKEQLIKSIDTTIIELIPVEVPELPDMVLRSIWLEALAEIEIRDNEIRRLNGIISGLEARILELEAELENLRIELDSQKILSATYQNQNQLSVTRVQQSIGDLQNSLQKATSEAIQRVSLTARVESLSEENKRLKDVLEGKQAKQAEGAKVGMDFSIKVITKGDASSQDDLIFNARAKDDGRGKWINGPDIEVYNFSSEEVTISFTQTGEVKGIINPVSSVTLKPKQTSKITLKTNDDKVDDFAPSAGVGLTGDKTYRGSFVAKSNKSTLNLSIQLQKQRGNQFG